MIVFLPSRLPRRSLCWVLPILMLTIGANQASAQLGACCLGNGNCIDTNQAGCDASSGEFLGGGTDCAMAVCDGACCMVDDTCTEGSADDCLAGEYQGAGSTCATHCAGPLGTAFTWQGQLKHNGAPLTGMIDLEASLWTAAVSGDPVGPTLAFDGLGGNPPPIEVVNGLFTVRLDFGPDPFDGDSRFLKIAVRSPHDPGDTERYTELSPRQSLTATPNALFALNADRLDGLDSTAFLQSIPVPLTLSGSFAHIIRGENASTALNAAGVFGAATATTGPGLIYGGRFESNGTQGRGVYGLATLASGVTFGGRFESNSTSGRGVFGWAKATSGTNYGVFGHSNSTSGFDFFASGFGTQYGSSSSIRWKRNIDPIDEPLDKVARLRGVYFDWDAEHGGQHDVGMIAEEVGAVLPEIVQYEENGTDAIGMDYSKLTPLLVEAFKELKRNVEAKDAEIAALCNEKDAYIEEQRTQIADLALRLERIEELLANNTLSLEGSK